MIERLGQHFNKFMCKFINENCSNEDDRNPLNLDVETEPKTHRNENNDTCSQPLLTSLDGQRSEF